MILVHLALLSGAAISRQFPPKASLFYRLVRAVTGRPICGWNGAVGVAVQAPGGRTTVDIAERSPDPVCRSAMRRRKQGAFAKSGWAIYRWGLAVPVPRAAAAQSAILSVGPRNGT